MKIKQIRNATLRINFGGVEFFIDPWLVSKSEGVTFGQSPFASEVVDPAAASPRTSSTALRN